MDTNLLTQLAHAPVSVKIGLFFGLWLLLWLPIAIPLAIALKWRPPTPPTLAQKLPLVASLYAIAPLVLWAAAWVDGIPFSAYGVSWSWAFGRSLMLGLGGGVLGLLLLFGLEASLRWVEILDHWQPLLAALLPTLALGLWVSVTEELVFRGFLLNQLQAEAAPWFAAIAASLIFAGLHLIWEGADGLPQLPGLTLMGLVLVLARWADGGSLGLACGLHAGWVWGMASLDTAGLIRYSGKAPEWLTGLAGRPLAGLLGCGLMVATGGMLWLSRG